MRNNFLINHKKIFILDLQMRFTKNRKISLTEEFKITIMKLILLKLICTK